MQNYYWKLKYYLSRGRYYRHWQIRGQGKEELYFDPQDYSLVLLDCLLANQISIATKTFNGANRQPCAWVKCSNWSQIPPICDISDYQQIFYNPKINPFWRDEKGNNIDKAKYETVITVNGKIYAKLKQKVIQKTLF